MARIHLLLSTPESSLVKVKRHQDLLTSAPCVTLCLNGRHRLNTCSSAPTEHVKHTEAGECSPRAPFLLCLCYITKVY
jgi:hypothetical protein